MSATSSTTRLSSLQSQYYSRPNQRTAITRSGSDQHLPRVEYDYGMFYVGTFLLLVVIVLN